MLRGLAKLTWLEIKIFVREPLGVIGSVVMPVVLFLIFGRAFGSRVTNSSQAARILGEELPIFISLFIALSAALSLVAVISIYREGGILKRLRATPLRPPTILAAHVIVKLVFTLVTLALMVLAGRRIYPVPLEGHFVSFAGAVLVTTLSVLSMGFVIASLVPTARFAQPIGSLILYPLLFISGIFTPVAALPQPWSAIAGVSPLTHAVSLLRGAWAGASWFDHLGSLGVLGVTMVVCVAISSKVFRWE